MQPKRNYSALDMPAHLKLKERQDGQGTLGEQRDRDFKEEIRRREREIERQRMGLPSGGEEEEGIG